MVLHQPFVDNAIGRGCSFVGGFGLIANEEAGYCVAKRSLLPCVRECCECRTLLAFVVFDARGFVCSRCMAFMCLG